MQVYYILIYKYQDINLYIHVCTNMYLHTFYINIYVYTYICMYKFYTYIKLYILPHAYFKPK